MPTVSHYEMLEKLGEGGMGVVWKARDSRLERFVALKLLPASKMADPTRRQRFVQEARAASALNHPRIITIYDIDRTDGPDGVDFIAMEFVPGRTLDQIIPAKGLRVAEALKYAIQIADALSAAHSAGIVHRDLKPANVMVTEKGDVKVLDFGLAKLVEDGSGISESDATRTVDAGQPNTEEGTVIGTAAYMSPEQAEGKKVDARADIFSFGAMLYEMLTGRRAFQGDSTIATLAAILNREPEPLETLNAGIPRELARTVQRCLRKDLGRRAHSMQDLKLALEEIKEDSDSGLMTMQSAAQGMVPRPPSRRPLLVASLAVIVVAAGGVVFWSRHGIAKTEPPLQAAPLTTFPGYESSPSFSPDGSQVAFAWNGEKLDNYDIYVQLVGSGRPLRLTTDPKRDISPAWSPDGRSIAFIRAGGAGNSTIMRIPALGGVEREVAQLVKAVTLISFRFPLLSGWTPDGRWLLTSTADDKDKPNGIFLVSVETGEKRRLTSTPDGFDGDIGGAISPDGRTVAFVRIQKVTALTQFISDIYSIPLTPDFRPVGEARRLTSDNATVRGIAWAAGGSEIVFSSDRGGTTALWRMAVSGSETPLRLAVGDNAWTLAISPRANRLIYEQAVRADNNIWRINLSDPATPPASFIASTREEESPAYSPDGKRIAFRSERSGTLEIWTSDADGSNAAQLTTRPNSGSPRWSPDSRQIAFDSTVDGVWHVFVVPSQGGQPRQLTSTGGGARPSWSSDGQWIYFSSARSGRDEIWKMPARGGSAVQLSRNGGSNPAESDDGKSIYYTSRGAIVKASSDGSSEATMIAEAGANSPFALTHDGIYYRGKPSREIRFYNFASGKSRLIPKPELPTALGITVSPDSHWLLYTQVDGQPGSDLMLVENFR